MEKREAYKFTAADAENYEQYLGPVLFEPYGQYLATQINSKGVLKVLELACGSGRVTGHLRAALPDDVELWTTDVSNDMLDIARRRLAGADIHFAVEDIQKLSFADDTFDLVVCQFGLMFLPDKQQGFTEIYRVLKPGGKLMAFTWDTAANNSLLDLLINELIVPLFADEDTSRFYKPYSLYDTAGLAHWAQNAGFKTCQSERVALPSGKASVEHLATAFFRKHPLGYEMRAKDVEAFEPMARRFERELIKRFGDGDVSFPMSAFLTVAVK